MFSCVKIWHVATSSRTDVTERADCWNFVKCVGKGADAETGSGRASETPEYSTPLVPFRSVRTPALGLSGCPATLMSLKRWAGECRMTIHDASSGNHGGDFLGSH